MSAIATDVEPWDETGSSGIPITVSRAWTVVRLEGEIDLAMAGEFAELIRTLPHETDELVLDVSGLTFCDATFAGFLAAMLTHMPVTVTHSSRWVRDFLTLVALDDLVRIVDQA
jgi:anti-anti-sigma factor